MSNISILNLGTLKFRITVPSAFILKKEPLRSSSVIVSLQASRIHHSKVIRPSNPWGLGSTLMEILAYLLSRSSIKVTSPPFSFRVTHNFIQLGAFWGMQQHCGEHSSMEKPTNIALFTRQLLHHYNSKHYLHVC